MKITIYAGITIEDKCRHQLHPVTEVLKAKELLDNATSDQIYYSNSSDFVFTVKHYGDKLNYDLVFFLDGVSMGDSIEEIFESFNKSFELMDNL